MQGGKDRRYQPTDVILYYIAYDRQAELRRSWSMSVERTSRSQSSRPHVAGHDLFELSPHLSSASPSPSFELQSNGTFSVIQSLSTVEFG